VTVTPATAGAEVASREVSLELIGLTRRFGPVVALDGLTFSVPPGEVFGFLEPNGVGKTTTMRAIFGVVALEAGEVRWRGRPVTEEDRHRFGYMPEERGLYLVAVGTAWMARAAATIYGRSILRTGSRVRLRQVIARGDSRLE
jgi:ABC-2 type transport system ATP-binding protein